MFGRDKFAMDWVQSLDSRQKEFPEWCCGPFDISQHFFLKRLFECMFFAKNNQKQ